MNNQLANYKFIVNPSAARGKGLQIGKVVEGLCRARALDYDLEYTSRPCQAIEIADRASQKFECIVAVGGDGTINEVVNGIIGKKVKLGIIPTGSGNDYVKVLNIPLPVQQAFESLLRYKSRIVDAGKAGEVYFANGLGIGFDAWVVITSQRVTKLRGSAIYLYSVLRTMYSYKSPWMRLNYNNTTLEDKMFMITVGNGVSLGGGFKLTPFAKLDDGLFDLNIVRDLSKFEIIQNLVGVYSGKHIHMPQVRTGRTAQILIESDQDLAAHVDGELIRQPGRSLTVQLLPKALEVIVPDA
jgi:YegS/Rv2252/BmrU family lipid kinase